MRSGWTASTKLAKYLLLGSTVLKQVLAGAEAGTASALPDNCAVAQQESPLYEHYYKAMKPDIHYVPFYAHESEDDLVTVGDRRHPVISCHCCRCCEADMHAGGAAKAHG
jgi:hypothetical protein